MVVIIGFLGLAVDIGQLRYARRNLQLAADAAALAAAMEIKACGATANCAAMQTAAQNALVENGIATSTLVTNCAPAPAAGIVISVNNPSCSIGAADPNAGKSGFVEVVVSQPQPMAFAKLLGFNNVPVSARAEAGASGGNTCMYALDPSGANAVTVDALAAVQANCGIMVESSSPAALSCNLLAAMHVRPAINVVGGDEKFLCSASPSPHTHAAMPNPADPFASLPKPAVPACGNSTRSPYHGANVPLTIIGNATLYSDSAYCGGINILPGANVTFMPGTYVVKPQAGLLAALTGGFSIDLGANVSGSGVTFYLTGPSGGVTFLASSITFGTTTLTAPTSGTYAGVLFFQDPQDSTPDVVLGSTAWNTDLEGAFYFPSASVSYALSGPANYNILVAYDIDFIALTLGFTNLTSQFNSNYSTLVTGSPIQGESAVLVQ